MKYDEIDAVHSSAAFTRKQLLSMDVPTLKVLIADDHQIFIEGLKVVLGKSEFFSFHIVGEVNTGNALLRLMEREEADLILLDMDLPDMDGLEVLSHLKGRREGMRVVTLSMFDEAKIVKAAFKAGTDGYILKSNKVLELHQAIKTVMEGHTYMSKGLSLVNDTGMHARFMQNGRITISYEDRFIKKFNLTKREIEVLKLVAQAMNNKEIASELYISDQTVSVHRKNIMKKLDVRSTASLIKFAFENNLI